MGPVYSIERVPVRVLRSLAMVDLRAQPSCFEMIGHGNTQKLCLKGSLRMLKNNLLIRKELTNERG
jgi:hypothetical protein